MTVQVDDDSLNAGGKYFSQGLLTVKYNYPAFGWVIWLPRGTSFDNKGMYISLNTSIHDQAITCSCWSISFAIY